MNAAGIENISGDHFTISAWIKAPRERSSNQVILAKAGSAWTYRLYIQEHLGLLRFGCFNVGDYGCGVVDNDQWNHVAVTCEGYNLNFFLNGVHLYTFDVPGGIPAASGEIKIGSMPDGSEIFHGEMDDLRAVNRTLSPSEISDLAKKRPRSAALSVPASRVPPAPLYEDVLFNSAKDGTVVWNRQEKNWWFIYMQIRNGVLARGVSIHHGTTIGAASSSDGGLTWTYRGILRGLEPKPGSNTFWAPDVVWHEGKYHAIISYVHGIHSNWRGDRRLRHYTSPNLMDWTLAGVIENLESNRTLDACLHKLPDGKWGLWYKDELTDNTGFAEGEDFSCFRRDRSFNIDTGCRGLEGADVFRWNGYYWLLGDDRPAYDGIRVYRSSDCRNWEKRSNILNRSGTRPGDQGPAHHPEAIVNGDEAFVFYWTSQSVPARLGESCAICLLQVAKLEFKDGELVCDRNRMFELNLPPEGT